MSAPAAIPPQYGVPPYTDPVEQPDNNNQLTTALSSAAAQQVTGIVPFKQTDVILAWLHNIVLSQTVTAGTGATVTSSPYYPYNYVGQYLLNMQQQYPAIAVGNLVDLVDITEYRPFRRTRRADFNYLTIPTPPVGAPSNLIAAAPTPNTAGTAQTVRIPVWLPASCYFDAYWEMSYEGLPLSGPHNGFVSPQDMAGYARVVTPDVTFNPVLGSLLDGAPFVSTGGTTSTTSSVTATHYFQRIGVLGNTDAGVLPGPTNWQYNIAHQRVPLAGRSQVDIPLNGIFMGQIMSVQFRMFDPSANGGLGAPITDGTLTKIILQYGGSSVRFQGSPADLQRMFFDQHRFLQRDGTLTIDLATDTQGWVTNAYCLNTLREAGITLHLEFTAAQSLTAYIEVCVEGLRWVPLTPVAQR